MRLDEEATTVEIDHAMWHTELLAFAATESTLTGATYARTDTGVAAVGAENARTQLHDAGAILAGENGKWIAATTPPDTVGFRGNSPATMTQCIDDAIRRGHDWPVPRKVVQPLAPGTTIPPEAVFLSDREANGADRAWATRWLAAQKTIEATPTTA